MTSQAKLLFLPALSSSSPAFFFCIVKEKLEKNN